MTTMTEASVRALLKTVIDPELGINVVDLGLLYGVDFPQEGDKKVGIRMTLTTPGCPLGPYFIEQVSSVVANGLGIPTEAVEVQFVFDPPWTQDMMDEEAIAQLGLDG